MLAAAVATTGFRQPNGAEFLFAALLPEVFVEKARLRHHVKSMLRNIYMKGALVSTSY